MTLCDHDPGESLVDAHLLLILDDNFEFLNSGIWLDERSQSRHVLNGIKLYKVLKRRSLDK